MTISIYHPSIKREAELFGITELQAYRKLNTRPVIQERLAKDRRKGSRTLC